MAQGIDGIDHTVILVRDLDRSRDLYARLGFTMTPRGTHSAHMGTGNYLVVLERDYVELLGVLKPTPNNAEWRERLAQGREGLSAFAISTQDAKQAHATLQARGMNPLEPLEFSRPVDVPGETREAAFSVVRLTPSAVPGLGLFVCGHKTRDLVWRREWQSHPNTAHRLVAITLALDDLEAGAKAWEKPFGPGSARHDGKTVSIATGGHAVLRLVAPADFGALFAGIAARGALTVGVRSTDEAAGVLRRNGVPHKTHGEMVLVAPEHASGVLVSFVPG